MTRDPGGILGNGLNEKNGSPVKECPEGDSVTDSPTGGPGGFNEGSDELVRGRWGELGDLVHGER